MRVVIALLLVELSLAGTASAATVSEGRTAYELNRVAEAEKIYAAVFADPAATRTDKSAAKRELARIAWLVDADSKKALAHLDAARQVEEKHCETAEMRARILRESRSFTAAERETATLLSACNSPGGIDSVRTHLIGAILDNAEANPKQRAELLGKASAEAAEFSADASIEAARLRLETGLLIGDAAGAMSGWRDYFWLGEAEDAPQALAGQGVATIFADGLRSDATADAQLKLAELLVRTGFGTESKRFAKGIGLDRKPEATSSPTWKRLDTYWREREKLETTLLRINRNFARGKSDGGETERAAKDFTMALMAATGASGDPRAALRTHYGIVGTVGSTNGFPSMHGGHVVEDRPDKISQYGKTADIHYIAIDNLISNGFTSWLWDGSAAVGGWTANGVIVQVRPRYVQAPLHAFNQFRDGEPRKALISREPQLAKEDLAKVKARPVATLEGLNNRLTLQLVDRVAAVARTKSSDDAGFRRAFLAEYFRANFGQSIEVHEGRHAIDNSLGMRDNVDQAVLEYQAKLSELALTAYPRMALINMNRALEGDGPHDRAGARIFDELRKWIEANPGQVIGYDPALPAIVQIDKLTDAQIIEIARSLDPLPNGKASPAKL